MTDEEDDHEWEIITVDTDEGEDIPEAVDEGIWYKWSCPNCMYVNESESDTRGDIVECTECGQKARHRG